MWSPTARAVAAAALLPLGIVIGGALSSAASGTTAKAPTAATSTAVACPTPSPTPTVSPSITPSPTPSVTPSPTPPARIVVGLNDHPIWLRNSQATLWADIVASGAKSARLDIPWDVLDGGSKGVYNTLRVGLIDAYVAEAKASGITLDMVATNAPQWANGSTDPHVPATNPADFAAFAAWAAARWHPAALEVWNEPNGGWAWTSPNAVKYAALLKATYPAVKAASPGTTVLAPSLSGPDQGAWLTAAYQAGIQPYFDAFAMHGYWWNIGGWPMSYSTMFAAYNSRIAPILAQFGDGSKPVWWTETGISTQGDVTTEADQAKAITDAYATARSGVIPNLVSLYWYDIQDTIGTGSEQNFGLINLTGTSATIPNPGDFVAKPGYAAFQAAASAN